MELLRTKTPSMARKEMATYMIAYNLIRALMWEAGTRHDADPLRISLKGTIQHLATISPHMANAPPREHRRLYEELLRLLAREIVPDRPDRVEPRVRKRRPKSYPLMTRPRHVLKRELLK
jgi:hypothetical protein